LTLDKYLDASDTITWFDFFHCRAGAISINTTLKQTSNLNNSRSITTRQNDYDGAVAATASSLLISFSGAPIIDST
jgi:hypothetical protein